MTVVGQQERVLVSEVVNDKDDEWQSEDQVDFEVVSQELSKIFELFPIQDERGGREEAREREVVEDLAQVKAGLVVLSIAHDDAVVFVDEGDEHEDDGEVRAGLAEISDANEVHVDEFAAPKVLAVQSEGEGFQRLQHTDLAVVAVFGGVSARLVVGAADKAPRLRRRANHELHQVGVLSFHFARGCRGVDVL